MNIRRVLAVAAIPFVIGTFGFVAPGQANAEAPSNRIVQSQQHARPQDRPHDKRQKPRLQQKKRPPQHKGARRILSRPPSVGKASLQENRPAPPPANR